MNFAEEWIEHDYNPFIVFDSNGKIISLNQEAQYLLGEVNHKKIFDIAQTYASITYGFKTTIVDIVFNSYKFYGITVGYLDENVIGIKLYKNATKKFTHVEEYGESVNIYALLDLCISAVATSSTIKFKKEFDPTFPDIYLNVENFMKLLTKIYHAHLHATTITTRLSLITGEYIRFNSKKYPIFSIAIKSDSPAIHFEKNIEEIAQKSNCTIQCEPHETVIQSALVS
ncbi:hypothetical protein [Sulfurospirillum deleyianum]|uniref:PAS domain-containing protein n=1 Tax=Sulfurospirillum deleyianum (strain ATCC 51133 / DSM 6946 / 5175) TaxID=525898 RepID=D1B393_SULD5|nr:hypothetical protein [Sulfurospirillum deleyianum]ACZ12563.1 conserved hypothetical protein [Sulfurospirillum deleyianum DSM 6946]